MKHLQKQQYTSKRVLNSMNFKRPVGFTLFCNRSSILYHHHLLTFLPNHLTYFQWFCSNSFRVVPSSYSHFPSVAIQRTTYTPVSPYSSVSIIYQVSVESTNPSVISRLYSVRTDHYCPSVLLKSPLTLRTDYCLLLSSPSSPFTTTSLRQKKERSTYPVPM